MAKIFYTPSGYSGTAQLTASNGLNIESQARWRFSEQGYNDGATFGVSLSWPDKAVGEFSYGTPAQKIKPESSGILHVKAVNWPIAVIGNQLQSYYNPDTGETYPASTCRILVTGYWQVNRKPNSNSWNSIGVSYKGLTTTDLGDRDMDPYLLNYTSPSATYVIQGADVTGGSIDTFTTKEFYCKCEHSTTSNNSNREYQSNSIAQPIFIYEYSMSWEITV